MTPDTDARDKELIAELRNHAWQLRTAIQSGLVSYDRKYTADMFEQIAAALEARMKAKPQPAPDIEARLREILATKYESADFRSDSSPYAHFIRNTVAIDSYTDAGIALAAMKEAYELGKKDVSKG
jgi:hypothetical protein